VKGAVKLHTMLDFHTLLPEYVCITDGKDADNTIAHGVPLQTMLLLSFLKQIAGYDWILSNLIASLRLNTFTKIDLDKWLNEPFTPPPENT
ncbi:MAG: hypothetical protein SNH67_01055, partial [Rikenellaceae bacterium]